LNFKKHIIACTIISLIAFVVLANLNVQYANAQPVPGGTLDPTTIPKYVTPLVIPPVMNNTGTANVYDIAVRQFMQQILPAAGFPATTVWSYGPTADPVPAVAPAGNSQFNFPAYTIETTSNAPVSVRWRNELVAIDPATNFPFPVGNPSRTFLPHLLPIDQTLHWANPPAVGCVTGTPNRTDCRTANPAPYTGPVPLVTHVHGAHVDTHSDGYPEAWWLPAASNIPAGYVTEGTLFDDALAQARGLNLGYVDYQYRNDQPATTLWYHDHSLGMTRNNVYAGPAGFWLIRGGANDLTTGLPGPAPIAGQGVGPLNTPGDPVRNSIREIPVVIQDRSFNTDGSLFYPDTRTFFDTYPGPFIPASDISPIWNPEAFFNTMVVNGTTWPTFEVAPALYRLRLLDGCNSRMLNLALFEVGAGGVLGVEHPFYQIGAEQGFLPNVVAVQTGFSTIYPAGTVVTAADPQFALLMGLAERADVIVDFRGLANGTTIRMINTAPDAPFGGFPDVPADPGTTGQVMEFVVNTTPANSGGPLGASPTDPVLADGTTPNPNAATDPTVLVLPAETALPAPTVTRDVSLNEEESGQVCVTVAPDGTITVVAVLSAPLPPADITAYCATLGAVPMAPRAALVGKVDFTVPTAPTGIPLMWTDMTGNSTPVQVTLQNGGIVMVPVTENPVITNGVAPIEEWNIYNFTVDAHPIHLHLVRFQVINRQPIPGVVPAPVPFPQQPWETGFKDTVIAYPGEVTTVRAEFNIAGLYVWHCHIVEHEDNEMMRPYIVSDICTSDAFCDDGNVCNGIETCNTTAGVCVAGTPLNCDDGNVCTDDSCNPASGCVYTNNTASCNDGNACTTADTCSGGVCVGGPALNCNDGNLCTTDSCDPQTGCANVPVECPAGQQCDPADGQCKTPPATFSISGTVTVNPSHSGLAGVTMILSGDANATTVTDAGGNYSFTGLAPGIYSVTPSKTGYRFGPPEKKKVRIRAADVTGINFNGNADKKMAPGVSVGGSQNVPSDQGTTVQVMNFAANTAPVNAGRPLAASPTDPVLADGLTLNHRAATNPNALVLPAETALPAVTVTRDISLSEEESAKVCVTVAPEGTITVVAVLSAPLSPADITAYCATLGAVPMAPRASLLGIVDSAVPAAPVGYSSYMN
jgi:spore coat protein A